MREPADWQILVQSRKRARSPGARGESVVVVDLFDRANFVATSLEMPQPDARLLAQRLIEAANRVAAETWDMD